MIYPWQTNEWQQILQAQALNRLAHALLLVGTPGTGKTQFAEQFVCKNLCEEKTKTNRDSQNNTDCNCHDCRLVKNKCHPNLLWIQAEKAGGFIKVDQIREINEFVNQTSSQGKDRFIVISPANAMNNSAANALLKTLEEPAAGAILLLISDQTTALPATIISRCQKIRFRCPTPSAALAWLQQQPSMQKIPIEQLKLLLALAHGAPLQALELASSKALVDRERFWKVFHGLALPTADFVATSAIVAEINPTLVINFLLTWTTDLLRLQLGSDVDEIANHDHVEVLQKLKSEVSLSKATTYLNYLQTLGNQINNGINLNKQLMIDDLLIRWLELK